MIISPWEGSITATASKFVFRRAGESGNRYNLGGFSWVSQIVGEPISDTTTTHRSSRMSKKRILECLTTVNRSELRSRRFNHRSSPAREVKTDFSSSGYKRSFRPRDRTVRGSGGRRSRSRPLQRSLSWVTLWMYFWH